MRKYNCPNCSAELYWDTKANALKCEYCDNQYQPEELDLLIENSIRKEKEASELREATEQDRVFDDSTKIDTSDLVIYACQNCGAEVITSKSTVATTCAFCGRAISLTDKMVGNFRPEAVIPFIIDEKEAEEIYKAYSKKGILIPKKFSKNSVIKKKKGVFIPFWLYSYSEIAEINIQAEDRCEKKVGYDKVIEHGIYDINLKAMANFENLPTDGLKNLDDDLMAMIEPYDYSKLTEFSPAYMAGFYAEEYDEDAEAKIYNAKARSQEAIEREAKMRIGPYTSKTVLEYVPTYEKEKTKYAMLPVWLFNVNYRNKHYQFAINGETGAIAGKLPISGIKLASIGTGVFLLLQLLAFLIRLIFLGG